MFEFGLYALILLLAALGFIIVPLMLTKTVVRESDDAANIKLAKNKLRELKADLTAGNISQIQFSAAKQELEVGLYHELHNTANQQSLSGNGRWLALPLSFLVPVMALALYAQLGDFRVFEPQTAKAEQASPPNPADKINEMVANLERRLEQKPNDLQGWLMLGRSYKAMKRYPNAVAALKKALALQNDNADIMLQIADTLAISNNGGLQGEANALIEQALKLQPDNEMGMWLSGLSKAESGQFDAAIAIWRKLQQRYQPGQSDYQEVQDMIDAALKHSGKAADPVKQPPVESTASATVNVRVELGDKFKASVKDDDSVLIYIKAANGPKMPLAAVKHQVRELPLQISFDDSMAMMPSMKISSVDNVVVTARVSRSGEAMPQPGEPTGSVTVKGEQRKKVVVVIDDQVR